MEEYQFTPRKRIYKPKTPPQNTDFYGLDLKNQGLKNLSPDLFNFKFLTELSLDSNYLSKLDENIKNLKNLRILTISNNNLLNIPSTIKSLTNLRELNLSNNNLTVIPTEIGALFNCEKLNLDNNPLLEPFCTMYKKFGGKAVINFCRDHYSTYPSPIPRQWINYDNVCINVSAETKNNSIEQNEQTNVILNNSSGSVPGIISAINNSMYIFTLGSYNVLCNSYATESFFAYVPSWALKWENRKKHLIDEIANFSFDILCTQEIEANAFLTTFRNDLEKKCDYDSIFYPKGRAKTMPSFGTVDGCATFWKKSKFSMIEHKCIEFQNIILNDRKFSSDVVNRATNKDNIALITVLKNKNFTLIVANVHIAWDPEYRDVKLIQTILLTEEMMRMKMKYPNAGIVLAGDFNSLYDSDVYKMIVNGKLESYCNDFGMYNYAPYTNGFLLNLNLKDSYCIKKENDENDNLDYEESDSDEILDFTNYTASFKAVIDYIFFNDKLECMGVLGGIDSSYADSVVGFPTVHLPSDHIVIAGKYFYKN